MLIARSEVKDWHAAALSGDEHKSLQRPPLAHRPRRGEGRTANEGSLELPEMRPPLRQGEGITSCPWKFGCPVHTKPIPFAHRPRRGRGSTVWQETPIRSPG